MKVNKQHKNWWIDALMLVGYLFCFYLEFTGVSGHEWLGACIGLLAVIHTWLHWDWVVAVTKRFFKGNCARSRWYYVVDVLIVIGFVVILETGLIISTWLNLEILNYVAWLDVHLYASYATLGLLMVKIGLHWRWVVNITCKIFASEKNPVQGRALQPVPVPVNKEIVDRRRFLGLMGVVGVGSLLAVINVVREHSVFNTEISGGVSAMGIEESPVTAFVQGTPSDSPAHEFDTSEDSAPASANEVAMPEQENTAIPSPEPTVVATQETQAAAEACQVRCSKSCAYPGRCRRYVDSNGNGLCDLGECM